MKFVNIYVNENVNIFLNMNDIKYIYKHKDKFEFVTFSGKKYQAEWSCISQCFINSDFNQFMEDKDKILYSIL